MTRPSAPVAEVLTLLERQRTALLTGDFAALDGVAARLERALVRLAEDRVPTAELARLGSAAGHVARLLGAARGGLGEAVPDRRKAATGPLMTYDAQGRQHAAPRTGQTLSRR
jgi:hypothetical protein